MKKTVIFIVCGLAMIGAMYLMFNKQPSINIGGIKLVSDTDEVTLKGYISERVYKDKATEYGVPAVTELTGIPVFSESQLFDTNEPDISYEYEESRLNLKSAYRRRINGVYLEETYSFYNFDGSAIALDQENFAIPGGTYSEQSAGCIVEIKIKWGKPANYAVMKYYFQCDFDGWESGEE